MSHRTNTTEEALNHFKRSPFFQLIPGRQKTARARCQDVRGGRVGPFLAGNFYKGQMPDRAKKKTDTQSQEPNFGAQGLCTSHKNNSHYFSPSILPCPDGSLPAGTPLRLENKRNSRQELGTLQKRRNTLASRTKNIFLKASNATSPDTGYIWI